MVGQYMASYFPEAGNLNGSYADMCSDVAWRSKSGSGDLFVLSERSILKNWSRISELRYALPAAIADLSVTTTPMLPFRACYVIMHKVYYDEYAVWTFIL